MTLTSAQAPARSVPAAVYVLAAGVFAMVTSEFAVAGLMPQLAVGLDTGIEQIGYLVTIFAVAMTLGGPLLALVLLRIPQKTALLVIFAVFLLGNLIAALATGYPVMVSARIVSGVAAQAFFGVAVSMSVRLVEERMRGRAIAVVMNGLMLGTLLGLPLATFIGGRFGWQSAFWVIALITVVAAVLTLGVVRDPADNYDPADNLDGAGADDLTAEGRVGAEAPGSRGSEFAVLLRPRFLLALASSTLIIGATFSAFSFFTPILTQVTGFSAGVVPLLLLAYGAATLIGNTVVGRLADRFTVSTLLIGTVLNVVFLTGFALFTEVAPLAFVFMLGIGLVGVTMNPAMAVRVQRAGSTAPLVNTVHASFITLGVIIGSAVGSALLPHFGLRSPIVLGIGLALLAILTIVPALGRSRRRKVHRAEPLVARREEPDGT